MDNSEKQATIDTRHGTKTKKRLKYNTTRKTEKDEQHRLYKKPWFNPGVRGG